jgi:hypothetical protein
MKNLYSILFVVSIFAGYCGAVIPLEQLEQAIAQSRLSRVKSLLSKVGREELSEQARMKLLGNLYDMAAELTDKRLESLSLFGNWRDAAQFFLGIIGLPVGIGGLVMSIAASDSRRQQIVDACFYGKIASGILICGGAYSLYKGITCSTQQALIAQATEVEEYIDKAFTQTELLEGGNEDNV